VETAVVAELADRAGSGAVRTTSEVGDSIAARLAG